MLAFDLGTALWWGGIAVGVAVVGFVVQMFHLSLVLGWGDRRTQGLGYYGQSRAERDRFKRQLRWHGLALFPLLRVLGRLSRFRFENGGFVVQGVAGPKGTCSEASFARAFAYEPRPQDVFVATQMKCGTTWMQHLVYQIVERGAGDLVETGRTLYAVSPWLEALKSVPIDRAPLLGQPPRLRIVKTHLPARVCPWRAHAKYIYVARHPVSCFASCVDFIETNVGAFAPPLAAIEQWFCSPEAMWWGTWPTHVREWWEWSQQRPNVLFVTFEDMRRDLGAVAQRVAGWLGVPPLTEPELAAVLHKCSFAYMSEHDDAFEMHPPHLLQTEAQLFVSGKAERHRDVPAEVRARILAWCRAELAPTTFPLAQLYPDVAIAPEVI